jgi:hypothetical protein
VTAGLGFQANLRKERALHLPHFGFGRAAIGGCFPDARIGCYRLMDGINDCESAASRGDRSVGRSCNRRNQKCCTKDAAYALNRTHVPAPRRTPSKHYQ